jgi:hypothetical protein
MFDLTSVPASRLLSLHSELLLELRSRNIVRSSNTPAELLFTRAFGWSLSDKSHADVDAIDANNIRYQVKCRKITRFNKSRQLGFIRRLPEVHFEYLAAVLIDEQFSVIRGAIIPHAVVLRLARYVESVKGWRMILRESVWDEPGVVDVTDQLRLAVAEL